MFERKSKLKQELDGAASILARFGKLQAAIKSEVTGPLAGAIDVYQKSLKDLAEAEVQAAVGAEGQAGGALLTARKRVDSARSAIDSISEKVRGLRGGVMNFGTGLGTQHQSLSAELPGHHSAIIEEFRPRWAKAIAAFSSVLGERAAIERLTGETLSLPEPRAVAAQLDAAGEPQRQLGAIKTALDVIASMREIAFQGAEKPALALHQVYRLTHAAEGLPVGSLVVENSLSEGDLRSCVAGGWAWPVDDMRHSQGGLDAAGAAHRIDREAETQRAAQRFAQQQARPDVDFQVAKMYPDLTDEERAEKLRLTPEQRLGPGLLAHDDTNRSHRRDTGPGDTDYGAELNQLAKEQAAKK